MQLVGELRTRIVPGDEVGMCAISASLSACQGGFGCSIEQVFAIPSRPAVLVASSCYLFERGGTSRFTQRLPQE